MSWVSAIGPSLLMVFGGLIVWLIKSRVEELRAAEERLTEARRRVYTENSDPYVTLFTGIRGEGQQKAIKTITSRDYRKTAFELSLFGSDDVVRAYNRVMQHAFQAEKSGKGDAQALMRLWGSLLLEIRRSLGNRKTGLTEFDMLAGMISDIEELGVDRAKGDR